MCRYNKIAQKTSCQLNAALFSNFYNLFKILTEIYIKHKKKKTGETHTFIFTQYPVFGRKIIKEK